MRKHTVVVAVALTLLVVMCQRGSGQQLQPQTDVYCDMCSNQYNDYIGGWTHMFDLLQGGFNFDDCLNGPWPDGSCHRVAYTEICANSHYPCNWEQDVLKLAEAVRAGDGGMIAALLSQSPRVQKAQPEGSYSVLSCDGSYMAFVSSTGVTRTVLNPKSGVAAQAHNHGLE